MSKRITKAALQRRIKALEEEIDGILSFHALPVVTLTEDQAYLIRLAPGFITVVEYAGRYCLHDGEIGQCKGRRYVVKLRRGYATC
jgi:hypothetical protein